MNNIISRLIEEAVSQIDDITKFQFVREIYKNNGKVYYVGGYVRDGYIGKESKDIDILVTGIPMDKLQEILTKHGRVDLVGESFGVLKFIPEGTTLDLDVSIPRIDKNTGDKYTDFEVQSDHTLPIEQDLFRRDYTCNAIARDVMGNIIDPFGGIDDIKNKIIRMVNPDAFSDDPLRLIRGISFSSRFGFTIEPKTFNMMKQNANKIKNISPERILIEFDKIVKKGDVRQGIDILVESGLYDAIFDKSPNISNELSIDNVKTMGEFIFCLKNNLIKNRIFIIFIVFIFESNKTIC